MNTVIRKSTFVPRIHYALPDNLKRLKRNPANLQVNTVHQVEVDQAKGLWLHHLRKSIKFAKFAVKNLTWSRELWRRNPGGVRIVLDAKFATKYLGELPVVEKQSKSLLLQYCERSELRYLNMFSI